MREMKSYTEREQVERAAAGDKSGFDALVDRHYKGLYALAYRILGNGEDAADATQIAFVKAHRSIKEFDTERPFRPWLYRICSNVCIDIARSKHRGHDSIEKYSYMLESDSRPHALAERSERHRRMRSAIMRLPERYRRIIVLRHYKQMDVEEIAETVGAPEGTIKSWLFRARAQLRGELAGLFEQSSMVEEMAV